VGSDSIWWTSIALPGSWAVIRPAPALASSLTYCDARAEPARHFAARFAAKEAAYKALAGSEEARHIHWQDIEVANAPLDGRPTLRLHGLAAKRAAELGVSVIHVTLTHSDRMAAAMVVLESASG
jgi:holo-[acyl-carrier protein] synthase